MNFSLTNGKNNGILYIQRGDKPPNKKERVVE